MRTQKQTDVSNTEKNKPEMPHVARESPIVAVHRAWLIGLAALVIIPWMVVGTIYYRHITAAATSRAGSPAETSPPYSAGAGPWGRLTLAPIVISPPLEYVAADWGRETGPDEWFFPGTPVEVMETFLAASGLSPEQIRSIRATARPDPRTKGLIVRPDPEMVRSFSPEVRARLYLELGKTSLNFDQANAFRFYGSSIEQWLGRGMISARTREIVEPLIYRDGGYLLFADPEIVRSQVKDIEELRRLAKALLREATMVVKVTVNDEEEAARLAEYWGRGGRKTDLRPLLESVVSSAPDHTIDIVHLLPQFARNYIYRYPRLTTADLNKPLIANCLWTALNFFNSKPDDRFLDVNTALNTLRRDYFIVEHGFQLGDIIAFLDANGNLFHVAVYLADDLVFSKNGTSPVAPWVFTTVDRLKGYYRTRSTNPRLIYHRRNDL
jgi:hypothetical protein